MSHKYHLRYELDTESGTFTKEEADGLGLTDALMAFSIIYPEDGSYSLQPMSWDGRDGGAELSHEEQFKVWLTFGLGMLRNGWFSDWRHTMLEALFEACLPAFRKDKVT